MRITTPPYSLLDLPHLTVQNICFRLALEDAKSFRLTCRKLYDMSLYAMLKRSKLDVTTLKEEDLKFAWEFMETIDFGRVILFTIMERFYSNTYAAKMIELATNMDRFHGDLSWTAHVSIHCPSLKSLNLKVPVCDDVTSGECNFASFLSYQLSCVKSFENLKELHIEYDGDLPLSMLDYIFPTTPHLDTLAFFRVRFSREIEANMKYLEFDEENELVFFKEETTICHWMFKEVWALGFTFVLPKGASTITILSSMNITWAPGNHGDAKLKQVKTDFVGSGNLTDIFPSNIESFYLKLPGWTLSELSRPSDGIIERRDYKNLTVASYITSKAMENIVRVVSKAALTKIHLIHVEELPSCRSTNMHMRIRHPTITNDDVIKICRAYPGLNVLTLENINEITLDFVNELTTMGLRLQRLKLIGCEAIRADALNVLNDNGKRGFHIDIWENAGKNNIFPRTFPGTSYSTQIQDHVE